MKSSTKIFLGVGVVAIAGGVIFLYMKGKKTAGALDPGYTTDSTAPGDHFRRYMTPPPVATASAMTAVKKKVPVYVPPPIPGNGSTTAGSIFGTSPLWR